MGTEFSGLSSIKTIPGRLQYFSKVAPDRELFVFYNKSGDKRYPYTAKRVVELAGKFSNRLRQNGFRKGDVIANTLPNSPERLITDIGIMMCGCISMNGQILLSDGSDFMGSAKTSRCNAIIICPDDDTPAWKLFKPFVTGDTSTFTTDISCQQTPDLTSAILVSQHVIGDKKPLLEDLQISTEEPFFEDVDPGETFIVFTTSGSTGYSKLVPRNQTEFIDTSDEYTQKFKAMGAALSISRSSLYNDRPLGWAGGFPGGALCQAQTHVLIDAFAPHGEKKDSTTWDILRREQCVSTVLLSADLCAVLTYVNSLGGETDFKIKLMGAGGQPLTKKLLKGMSAISDFISLNYGSTEALLIASTLVRADTEIKNYSCGKLREGVSLRIVNESGQECAPMEVGRFFVKGKGLFKGYFNRLQDPDPQTVKAFTSDGWFDMEDLGYRDKDDNIYVLGRTKDTIMYGAVVLYPGWLESKIEEHPDVTEACVLPVSDPALHHNICACVKVPDGCDLTEENLRAYCESIFIADVNSEQTPMPKFFMILKDFPLTSNGKMDKPKLRRMAEERFGYKQKETDP